MYRARKFYILDKTDSFSPDLLSVWDVTTDGSYEYTRTAYEKSFYPKNTLALIRILKGTMCLICNERTICLHSEEFIILPVSEIISYCSHSDILNYYWFNFTTKSVPFFSLGEIYKADIKQDEISRMNEILSFEEDELDPYCLSLVNTLFKEYFYRFILSLKKSENESTENFAKIIQSMRDRVTENISVKQLAEECHMSERSFRSMFSKYTGVTPKQYLIKIKMQNAAQILQTSDFSINKVSEKLGYSSPFQFSRDFKKYYGVSPNSYRKKDEEQD